MSLPVGRQAGVDLLRLVAPTISRNPHRICVLARTARSVADLQLPESSGSHERLAMESSHSLLCAMLLVVGVVLLTRRSGRCRVRAIRGLHGDDGRDDDGRWPAWPRRPLRPRISRRRGRARRVRMAAASVGAVRSARGGPARPTPRRASDASCCVQSARRFRLPAVTRVLATSRSSGQGWSCGGKLAGVSGTVVCPNPGD